MSQVYDYGIRVGHTRLKYGLEILERTPYRKEALNDANKYVRQLVALGTIKVGIKFDMFTVTKMLH